MDKSALVGFNYQEEIESHFLSEVSPTTRFHLMSLILNKAIYAICCFDKCREYQLVYVNETAERLWGFKRSEVLGHTIEELSSKYFGEELGISLKENTTLNCDLIRKSVDTSFRESSYLRSYIDFLSDESEQGRYLVCLTKDITPAKRTEEDLKKAHDRLAKTVQAAPGMIFELEMNNNKEIKFISVSEQVQDLFGVTEREACNDSSLLLNMVHPEDIEEVYNSFRLSAAFMSPFKWEGRIFKKNGEMKWVLSRAKPEKKPDGNISWAGITIDITEQKNLEKSFAEERLKFIQNSQLGELGKMAGSIAHEINNPIFAIRLSAENLLSSLQEGEIKPDYIKCVCQRIIDVSDRVTQIVKSLRQFSRDASQDPMVVTSVKQLIDDTLALCQQKFKVNGIDLKVPNIDEFLVIECRPVQISQVLINLINNSFDAVEGVPDAWVEISVFEKLDNVYIFVTDSGPGIPQDIANKILQPFFTTKPVGEGTGIGLSISDSIVRSHKGQLWIDSKCKNTRFCISLPKLQS